jgi:homoserine/homoserine lactone efflux protein
MELATLALFTLTFGSILILPGPNSAFAVGQSLKFGIVSSLVVPLGFMSATGIHALFVFSGIGLIVQEFSVALSILQWLGIIYLLWLACQLAVKNDPLVASKIDPPPSSIF